MTGLNDGDYIVIVLTVVAAGWLLTLLWLIITWERERRRERDQQRTQAMRALSRNRRRRD